MHTERAFQEAGKHGYQIRNRIVRFNSSTGIEIEQDYAYTLHDPEFWKSLGKERGWSNPDRLPKWEKERDTTLIIFYPDTSWCSWMHRYVDHAIEYGAHCHQDFFKQFYVIE